MKTQLNTFVNVSIPPLRVVEDNVSYYPVEILFISTKRDNKDRQKPNIIPASDPANWDENWFGNYE